MAHLFMCLVDEFCKYYVIISLSFCLGLGARGFSQTSLNPTSCVHILFIFLIANGYDSLV